MHKKAAFTMVELIFVIVILGILAAVAVPRLNASREDAQKAALKANIITALKDAQSYYAAQGKSYDLINEVTNVPFKTCEGDNSGVLTLENEPCVGFGIINGAGELYILAFSPRNAACNEVLSSPEIKNLLKNSSTDVTKIVPNKTHRCFSASVYGKDFQYTNILTVPVAANNVDF